MELTLEFRVGDTSELLCNSIIIKLSLSWCSESSALSSSFITIAFEVDGLIPRPAYEVFKREIRFFYAFLVHFRVSPLNTKVNIIYSRFSDSGGTQTEVRRLTIPHIL